MVDDQSSRISQSPADDAPGQPAVPHPQPTESGSSAAASDTSAGSSTNGSPASDSSASDSSSANEDQKTVISKRPPVSTSPSPYIGNPSPAEMGRTLEGERLGHFELEEFVGGGGMGAVFRATDTMLGRTVAVKVVSRDQTDEDTLRRFRNEAQSAARLNHENIARVYYVGEDRGWNYIVFEFIEGVNVRDLVEHKGPLPLDEAISYVLQVAEALKHAAQRDVVHRDIKPSNVLIMPDGVVKLVDMGLARLHQVESSSADLTASGVTLGTFDYISPEQARDPRSADVRSDLYSLGCTFYYMLTGVPPFPNGTVLQKLLSHSSDPPPDPRSYRSDLPDELIAALNKMLAKNPAQRYQDPNELIGALLLLAQQLGLPTAARGGAVWVAPNQSRYAFLERHLPWIVPVAVLVLAVIALQLATPSVPPTVPPAPRLSEPQVVTASAQENSNEPATSDAVGDAANSNDAASDSVANQSAAPSDPDENPATAPVASGTGNGPFSDDSDDAADPVVTLPAGGDQTTRPAGDTESPERGAAETVAVGPAARLLVGDAGGAASLGPTEAGRLAAELPDEGSPLEPSPQVTLGAAERPQSVGSSETLATLYPEAVVRVLVVGGDQAAISEDETQFWMPSLAAACREVDNYPELEAIELRYDGPRHESPFEVAVKKELTIRAGVGYTPVVEFAPEEGELMGASRPRMIRAAGGKQLRWEGVHFHVVLPAQAYGSWALFHLDQLEWLTLQNCTMTLRNRSGENDAAFFEFAAPRPSNAMQLDSPALPALPSRISLFNCIARGQATLVRAEEAVPFELNWREGLLATSERLLSAGGATEKPSFIKSGGMSVTIRNVTAYVARGIALIETRQSAPYQLDLVVRMNNSIFITDSSSPPLFEVAGPTPPQASRKKPNITGEDNFYNSDVILRIESAADGEVVDYTWEDQSLAREEKWYDERRPGSEVNVPWSGSVPPGTPVDEQLPADYGLQQSYLDMATDVPGYQQLPALPRELAEPPAPETTELRMPPMTADREMPDE